MQRTKYHITRIIPLLVLIALAVWAINNYWTDGKHMRAFIKGATALGMVLVFGSWLYSGHIHPRPFSRYILRYKQWRFFKRDILPFIVFTMIGIACAVTIMAIEDSDALREPTTYMTICGVVLIFGLINMIEGYVKYCYKHD